MSFLKAQVTFPLNFESVLSAIRHNYSVLFLAQKLYTLVKETQLKSNFSAFSSARVKTR